MMADCKIIAASFIGDFSDSDLTTEYWSKRKDDTTDSLFIPHLIITETNSNYITNMRFDNSIYLTNFAAWEVGMDVAELKITMREKNVRFVCDVVIMEKNNYNKYNYCHFTENINTYVDKIACVEFGDLYKIQ